MKPASVERNPASSRLASIDILRGVAALAVVCLHAMHVPQWAAVDSRPLNEFGKVLQFGKLGVALFFVISGFCIHLSWAKASSHGQPASIGFLAFWRRRLHRLYPPYFAALLLTMAIAWLRWRQGAVLTYPGDPARYLALDFIVHAFLLHGLHPAFDYEGGNVVYWTLAREEYLYLLYFALLAIRARTTILGTAACVLALGLLTPPTLGALLHALAGEANWWKLINYPFQAGNSAVALWFQWVLGAVAVEAHLGLVALPAWTRFWILAPVWAALAHWSASTTLGFITPFLWGMTFFTLVNAVVGLESRGARFQSVVSRTLRRLGIFSYSLYLVHIPCLMVFQKSELLLRARIPSMETASRAGVYHLSIWALSVVVTCLGGYLFFSIVERRFLNRRSVAEVDGARESTDRRSALL